MDKSIILKDLSKPENLQTLITYLQEAFRDLDVIYTETAPNGSLDARRGARALYNNSGTVTMWINTDGSTTWQQDDLGANISLSNLATPILNTDLDFDQNEAKQLVIENRTTDPASPASGEMWFRSNV